MHHQSLQLLLDDISFELFGELLVLDLELLPVELVLLLKLQNCVGVFFNFVHMIGLLLSCFRAEGLQVIHHSGELLGLRLHVLELLLGDHLDGVLACDARHLVDDHRCVQTAFIGSLL